MSSKGYVAFLLVFMAVAALVLVYSINIAWTAAS